jgi:hypothetical protein
MGKIMNQYYIINELAGISEIISAESPLIENSAQLSWLDRVIDRIDNNDEVIYYFNDIEEQTAQTSPGTISEDELVVLINDAIKTLGSLADLILKFVPTEITTPIIGTIIAIHSDAAL